MAGHYEVVFSGEIYAAVDPVKVRSDMAPGCPERFDAEFFIWLWNFPRDTRPLLEEALARHPDTTVVRLRSRTKIDEFVSRYPRYSGRD